MESKTGSGKTGRYDRKEMLFLDKPAFPLRKWLQHESKEDINILADTDLSIPEDLHQQFERAINILDSLKCFSGWWRSGGEGCQDVRNHSGTS